MFGSLAIFLSLPVFAAWVLMFPLGRAYLVGIQSARDPTHRLTVRGGWVFFNRIVSQRLRIWKRIWFGAYVLALATPLLLIFENAGLRAEGISTANFGLCIMYANVGLSAGLLIYASLVLLAPRISELFWLMAACFGISLFVLSPILFAASVVFFRVLSHADAAALRIFTFGFVFFPLQVLVLATALRFWARARGDHWFRTNAEADRFPDRSDPTGFR